MDEFNKLADQTNDFAVDERGEAVGDDGIMSSHPPAPKSVPIWDGIPFGRC